VQRRRALQAHAGQRHDVPLVPGDDG
jgi:hypothetical protein